MSQYPAPIFSNADFTAAYLSLMPTGNVWPRDSYSVIAQTISGLAPTYERQTQDLANLLADAFPSNPVQLLYEWQQTLGLPNPYVGTQTLAQQQAQVLQKFANDGGQTVAYFLSLLTSLGFSGCTITEYTPFTVGKPVGLPITGSGWSFVWLITAPTISVSYFTAGTAVGTALYELVGTQELEFIINQYAPAHTYPLFAVA